MRLHFIIYFVSIMNIFKSNDIWNQVILYLDAKGKHAKRCTSYAISLGYGKMSRMNSDCVSQTT